MRPDWREAIQNPRLKASHVTPLVDIGFSALAIVEKLCHEATDITF